MRLLPFAAVADFDRLTFKLQAGDHLLRWLTAIRAATNLRDSSDTSSGEVVRCRACQGTHIVHT